MITAAKIGGVALLTSWAVASCGSSKADFACGNVYAAACGVTCNDNNDCALGLHCGNGKCGADCSPAGGCGADQQCSLDGACVPRVTMNGETPCGTASGECPAGFRCSAGACRAGCATGAPCPDGTSCSSGVCVPPDLFPNNGGGPDGGGFYEGDGCVNLNVGFEGRTPTVLLLVDNSGSMTARFGRASRFDVLRGALMDPATGAVRQMQASVRMGLSLYSWSNGQGTCPHLTNVPIAINNYAAINAVYARANAEDNTPTGASIDAAVQALANEPDPKYILLVTDGLPDTCEDPDANGGGPTSPRQLAANARTVSATQAAYKAGVGVFVMGVSSDIAPAHLQEVANAGAGKDPRATGAAAAKYYVASDSQAELAMQLGGILGSVRSCTFHLQGVVDLTRALEGIVTLDGVQLAYNDPNGYRLNGPSDLEITGAACEKIKLDGMGLSVSFPCGVVTEIPR